MSCPGNQPHRVWTTARAELVVGTDWDEVTELVTESYCVLAPKKLRALVDRPEPPA